MKEATRKLLEKTRRAIHAAEVLLKDDEIDFAAGRAYYAMFYTAEALLNEKGLRFRKHGGVHGAFGEHFVKTRDFDAKYHRWLIDAFDKRVQGDYDVESVITSEDVEDMIRQAQEFLETAEGYLAKVA